MKYFALTLLPLTMALTTIAAEPPKNIVLILADDLGWADTTLYGKISLYETPNIERLAARGMTFTNAYAASPICSPTRAIIMTGQNPARHGMTSPSADLPEVHFEPIANTGGSPHQNAPTSREASTMAVFVFQPWSFGRASPNPVHSATHVFNRRIYIRRFYAC